MWEWIKRLENVADKQAWVTQVRLTETRRCGYSSVMDLEQGSPAPKATDSHLSKVHGWSGTGHTAGGEWWERRQSFICSSPLLSIAHLAAWNILPPPIYGKLVFHKTRVSCQKGWGAADLKDRTWRWREKTMMHEKAKWKRTSHIWVNRTQSGFRESVMKAI